MKSLLQEGLPAAESCSQISLLLKRGYKCLHVLHRKHQVVLMVVEQNITVQKQVYGCCHFQSNTFATAFVANN